MSAFDMIMRIGKIQVWAALIVILSVRSWAQLAQSSPVQSPPQVFSIIKDAAEAIAAGDLDRAENELHAVLRTNPNEYRALNLLGVVRAQQSREQEAEQLFKQAIKIKPDFASAHVDLALLYSQVHRENEAESEFQEALRLDSSRTDARESLLTLWRAEAAAAVHTGDLERALAILKEARRVSPQNPDILFEFGMVTLHMSLFSDSIQAFQAALKQRNDDTAALYGLGRAQIGVTEFQDARESFERYVRLRPGDASGYYALGFVLAALHQSSPARHQLQKSIELRPVQTESYFWLGLIDLDEGNLEDALSQFRAVLKRDPRHAGALTGVGRVAFQQKDYLKAADFLQQAVSSDPSLRQAHYYLGLSYARSGRTEDSQKELQLATQLEHEEVEKKHLSLRLLDSE